MSAFNDLINLLTSFTPEQLENFLEHPLTQSILQAEEATAPYPLEAS
jgi:hypothetical protein